MDLRQIRYFTMVAREGNVSRAAERLHVSQPALSRQIHALEEQLGVALIERHGRGIRLTRAAEQLLPRCAEILSQAAGLQDLATTLSDASGDVIKIGATPHFIESLMARVLREFRVNHPGVDIVLEERATGELATLLEHNEVHLALGAHRLVGAFPTRPLTPVPLMVVPPDGHRFLSRDSLELDEVVTENLLVLRRGFLTREVFESACQLEMHMPSVRHESESVHTLLALVEAEWGVAILQANANIERTAIPLLHDGKNLRVELSAAWNPHAHLPPATMILVDAVDSALREKIHTHKVVLN